MKKASREKEWTFQDSLKEFLKDPEIKEAYDELEADDHVQRALIELRLKNKQTQRKLADKLDTKQAYISRIEKGGVSPTVTYIAKMADALNADAEIVFHPRGSKEVIKAILVKENKPKYRAKRL